MMKSLISAIGILLALTAFPNAAAAAAPLSSANHLERISFSKNFADRNDVHVVIGKITSLTATSLAPKPKIPDDPRYAFIQQLDFLHSDRISSHKLELELVVEEVLWGARLKPGESIQAAGISPAFHLQNYLIRPYFPDPPFIRLTFKPGARVIMLLTGSASPYGAIADRPVLLLLGKYYRDRTYQLNALPLKGGPPWPLEMMREQFALVKAGHGRSIPSDVLLRFLRSRNSGLNDWGFQELQGDERMRSDPAVRRELSNIMHDDATPWNSRYHACRIMMTDDKQFSQSKKTTELLLKWREEIPAEQYYLLISLFANGPLGRDELVDLLLLDAQTMEDRKPAALNTLFSERNLFDKQGRPDKRTRQILETLLDNIDPAANPKHWRLALQRLGYWKISKVARELKLHDQFIARINGIDRENLAEKDRQLVKWAVTEFNKKEY